MHMAIDKLVNALVRVVINPANITSLKVTLLCPKGNKN